MRRQRRLGLAFALAALLGGALSASAVAVTETATLHAAFSPDRLGASTTISFGFRVSASEGVAPPPMTSLDLRLPADINYTTTTLGLAICLPSALLAKGLVGCSPNSRVGYGDAFIEVPFGVGSDKEIPELQAVMGPPRDGNIVVRFYANGLAPVFAQLVSSGEVLLDSGRFRLAAFDDRAARRKRSAWSRRLDRQRADDDRPEPPDLLPAPPRPPRAVPPGRRQRPPSAATRRLPIPRRIRLPRQRPGDGVDCRAVTAGNAMLRAPSSASRNGRAALRYGAAILQAVAS